MSIRILKCLEKLNHDLEKVDDVQFRWGKSLGVDSAELFLHSLLFFVLILLLYFCFYLLVSVNVCCGFEPTSAFALGFSGRKPCQTACIVSHPCDGQQVENFQEKDKEADDWDLSEFQNLLWCKNFCDWLSTESNPSLWLLWADSLFML